jgi:hypothetical protein
MGRALTMVASNGGSAAWPALAAQRNGCKRRHGGMAPAGSEPMPDPIQKPPLKSALRTHGNLRCSAWPLCYADNSRTDDALTGTQMQAIA